MNKRRDVLIGILVSLNILHDVPALSLLFPSSLYAIIVIGAFFYLAICVGLSNICRLLPFLIIPLLAFVTGVWSNAVYSVSVFMQRMILPMTAMYIIKTGNKELGKALLAVFVVLQIITSITTCMGLIMFPNASRMQGMGDASESPDYLLYRSMNIGGFDFIYTLVVLFPIIILSWMGRKELFNGKKNIVYNIIIIGGLILFYLTVFQSQYTTAIIIMSLSTLMFFIRKKLSLGKIMMIGIIGIVFFSLLKPIIVDGIFFVSKQMSSEIVQSRLNDIGLFLQGRATEGDDFDERRLVWELPLATFVQHPLGTWGWGAGGHSVWLDSLAIYGIFGLIAIVILIHSAYNRLIIPLTEWKLYNCSIFVFASFLLTALLNPHSYTNVLLFIMPVFMYSFFDVRLLSGTSRSAW